MLFYKQLIIRHKSDIDVYVYILTSNFQAKSI